MEDGKPLAQAQCFTLIVSDVNQGRAKAAMEALDTQLGARHRSESTGQPQLRSMPLRGCVHEGSPHL